MAQPRMLRRSRGHEAVSEAVTVSNIWDARNVMSSVFSFGKVKSLLTDASWAGVDCVACTRWIVMCSNVSGSESSEVEGIIENWTVSVRSLEKSASESGG